MSEHDKRERRRLARERLRRLRERARQREAALKKTVQGGGDAEGAAGVSKTVRSGAERAAALAAKDAERKRKLEIEQLERDVDHLSNLSDPTAATATEIIANRFIIIPPWGTLLVRLVPYGRVRLRQPSENLIGVTKPLRIKRTNKLTGLLG